MNPVVKNLSLVLLLSSCFVVSAGALEIPPPPPVYPTVTLHNETGYSLQVEGGGKSCPKLVPNTHCDVTSGGTYGTVNVSYQNSSCSVMFWVNSAKVTCNGVLVGSADSDNNVRLTTTS